MEKRSWGQWMDWAWQPISSRKPFSGCAKAARCDPIRLSAGGKAQADGPNGCPWRPLRPRHAVHLKHSGDNAEAGLVSLWGDEEQRFEAKAVPWTAGRITDVPAVSITSPSTGLHGTEPRERLQSLVKEAFKGVHLYCWSPLKKILRNMFVGCLCESYMKISISVSPLCFHRETGAGHVEPSLAQEVRKQQQWDEQPDQHHMIHCGKVCQNMMDFSKTFINNGTVKELGGIL